MNRNKILVPIDIDSDSTDIFHYASSLAASINARISYVAILDNSSDKASASGKVPRRTVELTLSKIVNENSCQAKTEYDIIVTQGEFAQRVQEMSLDLDIDLIILQIIQHGCLKSVISKLTVPVILFGQNALPSEHLNLYLDLDKAYSSIVRNCIHAALLLNSSLNVFLYAGMNINPDLQEFRINDIRQMIERETIACSLSYHNQLNYDSLIENYCSYPVHEMPVMTPEEFELLLTVIESLGEENINTCMLIPSDNKYRPEAENIKHFSF